MKTWKIIAYVFCLLAVLAHFEPSKKPETYTLDCTLVEYDDGDAVFEDNTGNLWAVPEEECSITVGSDCVLVMDYAGTPTIYDDIIIDFYEKTV